jgi:hypothetical protein
MEKIMKNIDEQTLECDLGYRFGYLSEFVGFGVNDIALIVAAGPQLAEHVPALVEATYQKLFSFDATKRHFVKPQSGYEGPPVPSLNELTHDHPAIKYRKEKLARYLVRLVTGPYDAKMVAYLDFVGKIHTDKAGSKDIVIPLVQMNALMGFVADALISTISGLDLPAEQKTLTLRAFSKLLWLQNDLITRHYQK